MSYRLLDDGGVLRYSDGASIPPTRENNDWREYLDWVAAGNVPDPAIPSDTGYPTTPEILNALIKAVLDNSPADLQLIRQRIGTIQAGPLPR